MNWLGQGLHEIWLALHLSLVMLWDILWGLNLGFALSAAIDVVVPKSTMGRLLPDDSPRSIVTASALGAASSSCSYAAVAVARSIVRKGADFTAAMAFQFASTNLVIELGILLAVLLAWQFTLAEFVGGPLMIVILVLLFRLFLRRRLVDEARQRAEQGVPGSMEGHAAMAQGEREGTWLDRLTSAGGWTEISHYFVMNWQMLWKDIAAGLLVAGALGAWVPDSVWQGFFLSSHPLLASFWGPIIGPVIAVLSFTCSIGNVPLAAVLWNGGISFGGVTAFIFGDLIILPILNIYRKYYGRRMSLFLLATFYAAMVLASWAVEWIFRLLDLVPSSRAVSAATMHVSFNYTSVLNIIFLLMAGFLAIRFVRTGGPAMMRAMARGGHDHVHHHGGEGVHENHPQG